MLRVFAQARSPKQKPSKGLLGSRMESAAPEMLSCCSCMGALASLAGGGLEALAGPLLQSVHFLGLCRCRASALQRGVGTFPAEQVHSMCKDLMCCWRALLNM